MERDGLFTSVELSSSKALLNVEGSREAPVKGGQLHASMSAHQQVKTTSNLLCVAIVRCGQGSPDSSAQFLDYFCHNGLKSGRARSEVQLK